MLIALVVVHLQAVLVPLWVAMRCRGWWLKSGFVCFSLASLAEMVDHTTTDWVYVNHNSFFNGVFYGALATGLALLTAAVSRSRSWRLTLLLITMAALVAYPLAGKLIAIGLQSLLLVLMLCQWWRRFADPRLWLYVLFGVVLITSCLGVMNLLVPSLGLCGLTGVLLVLDTVPPILIVDNWKLKKKDIYST